MTASESVKAWLKKNGYPFEMKVASIFQQAGFGIHQAIYFPDPNTDMQREMDILVICHRIVAGRNFNIVFPIECKYAISPWILFSSITKGFPICYLGNSRGLAWMNHAAKQGDWENFFEQQHHLGFSLKTMGVMPEDSVEATKTAERELKSAKSAKEGKENAYSALQSMLAFLHSETTRPQFAHPDDFVFYVPIIVIKGKLVEARLVEGGELECNEILSGQIIYKQNIAGVIPKFHIVTEDALNDFVNKAVIDCERLTLIPYLDKSVIDPPFRSHISVVDRIPKITP